MERYSTFLHALRDQIVTGELQPGDFILPENTLSEQYGLSRVSVRKALAELVADGLIEKIPGKGSRIRRPETKQSFTVLRLAWFSTSYELDIVNRIIEAFEQLHPFVKVELDVLPTNGYTDALVRSIDAGQGPDVFMMSDVHAREWIDRRKTDDVEGYVPDHLNEKTSYPQVFELFAYKGRMLGAPFLFSPVVICYNKALFRENGIAEPPKIETWDDLLQIAIQCTRDQGGSGITDQYGFCFSSSYNRWPVFLLQNEGKIMSDDGKRCMFAMERNIEALQFCISLMYRHQVSPIYSHANTALAESLFVKQRVAMIMTTYYCMNEFRDRSIEWDVLPMPQKRQKATLLLGGALAMNAKSERKRLAQRLIDFMTGTVAQMMLKSYSNTIPALRSVAEDNKLLNPHIHPEHYNYFLDVLPYAKPLSSLGFGEREIGRLCDELDLLWANMESPEEACARIEAKFNGERSG